MSTRIAAALFLLLPVLMLAPSQTSAQEASEGSRKIVSKVIPQYPGLARAANVQGIVKADVIVSPTGKVQSIEVKGGHPVLAKAAQEALKEWKWESAAHETHEIIEIRFKP